MSTLFYEPSADVVDRRGNEMPSLYVDTYVAQRVGTGLREMGAEKEAAPRSPYHPQAAKFNYHSSRDEDLVALLHNTFQSHRIFATMSEEESTVITIDPMVNILGAFYLIPTDYRAELFTDFREAANSQDLRRLLDTISDWSATAELYAHHHLASDLQEAIGGRKGVADWLPG